MEELKDKVALVTGGTKGIGLGIAECLMAEGIHVAITGRDSESTKQVAETLTKQAHGSAKAIGIKADVRDLNQQRQMVTEIINTFGSLDIVIANAGLGHFNPITDLTEEQWRETIDTNLTGVFYTIKATVQDLIKSKGYFITISSLAGTNFFAGGAAYNASKFGLTGFSQAVMLDLRKHDVKVSTIMPGSVSTQFNNNKPNDNDYWKIQKEDIGKLIVDLLKMHPRTLPSKIEVRPSRPPGS